jgi:hypothetical protein
VSRRDLRELHDLEYGVGRSEPDGTVTQGRLYVDREGIVRWTPDVPTSWEGPPRCETCGLDHWPNFPMHGK